MRRGVRSASTEMDSIGVHPLSHKAIHLVECLLSKNRPGAPMLALGAGLPLWSRTRHLIHEVLLRCGANREMGLALYRVFQEAGLPAPKMHLEMPLGNDADFIRLTSDVLCSLRPIAEQHKVSVLELDDLDTLPDRICAEVAAANTVVSLIAVVGAWSRKPINT